MQNFSKLRKLGILLVTSVVLLSTFAVGTSRTEAESQEVEIKFIGVVAGFFTPYPSATDIIATVEQVLYDPTGKLKSGDQVSIDAWGYGPGSVIDWPLETGDRIEVFGDGFIHDTPDSDGCIARIWVGFLPYYLKTVQGPVKFRGTIWKASSEYHDIMVEIDEVLLDPEGRLSAGDLAYVDFGDDPFTCRVDWPLYSGERVEVYAKHYQYDFEWGRVFDIGVWIYAEDSEWDGYIIKVGGQPDLTFDRVGFNKPEPLKEGDVIYFGADIVNQGEVDASDFRVEVHLDNQPYDSGVFSLDSGESTTLWADYPWTATPGSHTVTWIADTTDVVMESNEYNNEMSRTFAVGAVAEWTVMAYLDGDNNLEKQALRDLNEMEIVGSTSDVTILALLDRHPKHDSSDGDWSATRLYRVTKDDDLAKINSELLKLEGELNMGNSTTLSNFIKTCISRYPAKRYALIMMDHGGGWVGLCEDETDNDHLGMTELKQALQDVGKPIDLMAFEACLMGMIEVGYQVKDYIHVMVGSEDYIRLLTGPLWWHHAFPYDVILSVLTDDPKMDAKKLGATMVEKFKEEYEREPEFLATASAVDLDEIDEVANSVDNLAKFLKDNLHIYKDEITHLRSDIAQTNEEYGKESGSDANDDLDYIDLYYFAQMVKQHIKVKRAETYADEIMNKIDINKMDSVVIAEWHQILHRNSHGLSILFPETRYQMYDRTSTLDFAHSLAWDKFLNEYTNEVSAIATVFARDSTRSLFDNVIFTVDGQQYYTPKALGLMRGNHRFHVEAIIFREGILVFDHWEDETETTVADSTSFSYDIQANKWFYAVYGSIFSGTGIELQEDGQKLFLHVYDGEGRHVGLDYALNQTEVEVPGAYYYDSLNGTISIIVPSGISKLRVVVDASYAEEPTESFNLTAYTIANSQISERQNLQSSIRKGEKQAYTVTSSEEGSINVTPSRASVTRLAAICGGIIALGLGCYLILRHRRRVLKKQ